MAIKQFAQKVWEARLLENFHEVSVADAITTKPTRMDGHTVTFNKVKAGSVKDYTGTVSWDDVDTEPIDLAVDFKKYFGFALDDVDKAQTNLDVVDATTKEHSALMAEEADKYVFGKAIAGAGIKIGTVGAQKEVTKLTAYDYIVDLGTELGKKKVPVTDRFVVIDNTYLNLLCKDDRFTRNPEVLANGMVSGQKINGMQVVISENKPANTAIAMHKSAVGWGKQIDEVEAMRLQDKFADGIRGLVTGGSAVLRSDAVAILHYKLAAQV